VSGKSAALWISWTGALYGRSLGSNSRYAGFNKQITGLFAQNQGRMKEKCTVRISAGHDESASQKELAGNIHGGIFFLFIFATKIKKYMQENRRDAPVGM
jgi:hypothetical protein